MSSVSPARPWGRRAVLRAGAAALSGLVLAPALAPRRGAHAQAPTRPTPAQALQRLIEGNQRFASSAPPQADVSEGRRAEQASGQRPFAAIVSCSDSRVPTEIIFDQGLGDLFVCRLAGNIVDIGVAGSVEYAVAVLGVSLIFVLGHESCGAVKAAVDVVSGAALISPNIDEIVHAIRAPVERARGLPGDLLQNAIQENVRFGMRRLLAEPELAPFLADGRIQVAGGEYNLSTGVVDPIEAR